MNMFLCTDTPKRSILLIWWTELKLNCRNEALKTVKRTLHLESVSHDNKCGDQDLLWAKINPFSLKVVLSKRLQLHLVYDRAKVSTWPKVEFTHRNSIHARQSEGSVVGTPTLFWQRSWKCIYMLSQTQFFFQVDDRNKLQSRKIVQKRNLHFVQEKALWTVHSLLCHFIQSTDLYCKGFWRLHWNNFWREALLQFLHRIF